MHKLKELYRSWSGELPVSVTKLEGAGSNRLYFRMVGGDGRSVIGTVGTSREENHAFIYLAKHFAELGQQMKDAFAAYISEVQSGAFPAAEHTFKMEDEVLKKLY
jgi:hypothetical protein